MFRDNEHMASHALSSWDSLDYLDSQRFSSFSKINLTPFTPILLYVKGDEVFFVKSDKDFREAKNTGEVFWSEVTTAWRGKSLALIHTMSTLAQKRWSSKQR